MFHANIIRATVCCGCNRWICGECLKRCDNCGTEFCKTCQVGINSKNPDDLQNICLTKPTLNRPNGIVKNRDMSHPICEHLSTYLPLSFASPSSGANRNDCFCFDHTIRTPVDSDDSDDDDSDDDDKGKKSNGLISIDDDDDWDDADDGETVSCPPTPLTHIEIKPNKNRNVISRLSIGSHCSFETDNRYLQKSPVYTK